MRVVVEALWPTFALIAIGALFRRCGFPGEGFWAPAVRLAYFVLLPVVICRELATARLTGLEVLPMGAALVGGVLALALPILGARPVLGLHERAFGSVFQGSIRFNTYVGLATAPALAGGAGGPLAALAITALVPLVNLLSVAVLTRRAGVAPRRGATVRALVTNPLLLACALGIALNWSGVGLPPGTGRVTELLGRAALPLGLLTVGAGLEPRALGAAAYPIALASGLKLLALPAVTAGLCALLGVEGTARAVAVLFAALPTAPAAYALAQQLGGDAELMAGILTMQTLLAVVTLPLAWTLLA